MRCIGRLAVAGLLLASAASAAVVTLRLDYVFSGTFPVSSLVAEFSQASAEDPVTLTLNTMALTGTAVVDEWDFNLNPLLDPTQLVFTPPTGVNLGRDGQRADGDGLYDIWFKPDNHASFNGFTAGIYTYTISGIEGLKPQDFAYPSVENPGSLDYKGPFYSAAHVQGNDGIHAWIASVPDGGMTLMLLGGALIAVETLRRRFTA